MEEQATKSGMSTGAVLAIAVVVAIAFGGGAYAYVNSKATKEKNDLNSQISELQKQIATASTATTTTPTSSTSATTATDKTADWKTYTNNTLGFSFKYPKDWTIKKESLPSTTASKNLVISNASGTLELDLWVDADGFGPFFPNLTYTLEQSGSGVKVSSREVADKDENNSGEKSLIITKPVTLGSHGYLFHFIYPASNTDSEQTFKDILSSFQFTT